MARQGYQPRQSIPAPRVTPQGKGFDARDGESQDEARARVVGGKRDVARMNGQTPAENG